MRSIGARGGAIGAVLAAAATLALAAGCGSGSDGTSAGAGDSFDAMRAWRLIERQVAIGPRPAGSPQLQQLARVLRSRLPAGRLEPLPGERGLRNVVGMLPGAGPAIVVGAHYDTLTEPPGFVGANNGAAGTAAVVEIARALAAAPAQAGDREVRFVLFDGEEPPAGLPEESVDFYSEGLRGSRAYVDEHGGEVGEMILLDYIAGKRLFLPREAGSSEQLWSRLLGAAATVGAGRYFSAETGSAVTDDHTPFARAGIPAIDLIDWRYPGHTLEDDIDALSLRSLDAVGETVTRLVEELRREAAL